MTDSLFLLLAWLGGGVLGTIFFGGLWWTIRQAVPSKQPALWFIGSFVLRMAIVVVGFYFIGNGRLPRLLLCLLGFLMARSLVMRCTRTPADPQPPSAEETSHAPQS